MLKMHIYAITKEEKIVRLCGCGNVILGKSPRCDTCRLFYNAKRKANQRKRNKEKLISNNT